MKYPVRFAIVANLICSAFLFAQRTTPSTEETQQPPTPGIIVLPASAEVTGGGGQQFSASVPGSAQATFTWGVSGPGCTGGTCGSISSAGLYRAPLNVASPMTITVTATLASDPLRKSSATVTVQPKTGAEAALPSPDSKGAAYGGLEVLSDTMGVNFDPYLARVLHDVKMNWYKVIPASAKAPIMKKGNVVIEFAILNDGSVSGMKLVYSSGDVALDRAAWQGIVASSPQLGTNAQPRSMFQTSFPPLPVEFGGKYLALRMKFLYNPEKADLR